MGDNSMSYLLTSVPIGASVMGMTNTLQSALDTAATHGWTIQRNEYSDAIGILFARGQECMTSEWRDDAMSWADYSSPSEPECVYTEHFDVMTEFLSTLPTT